jgi:GAF domain-containing protein
MTDISDRKQAEETTVKRAAELATVADVGTTISTILEEQQLLETVVQLTRERFDLYHCHIFLADETYQTLQVKACGWEEGSPHIGTHGDTLIHTDQEQSLVAQAARSQQAVIVNNVQEDPNWLPNELLPDTRSEMAIPMVAGGRALGVLDVQAAEVDRFTDEDISIMTTLASQVAVALQNARTYAQTQQLADQEAMINLISQRIQSTTSVEDALQVAIRELGRALGAKRTNVQLGLPSQQNKK